MAFHNLKSFKPHFDAVWRGVMTAQVRYNDRGYSVDDVIALREGEYNDGEFQYTGRVICCVITHITDFGCDFGHVCLSITPYRRQAEPAKPESIYATAGVLNALELA